MLKKLVPPLEWLRNYNSDFLKNDIVAGITVAAYGIPVSMAYASLAGLPPQYGIYGYLIGGLFYAMLGTSKQLAIGPTSAISLLIGTTLAEMAAGDVQRWSEIASLTGLLFAVFAIAAYFLRLSGIINFISDTVLLGFKAGAALTIGITQLPKLFGVPGGGNFIYERLSILFDQLPQTNFAVLIFGIAAIFLLILGEKLLPGRPVAIVVVAISILLISFTSIGSFGLPTVGFIPSGLPYFHIPSLEISDINKVGPLAFACFLLSYIESVATAKSLAQKNKDVIDMRQELIALGVANATTALAHGYPIAGGLSQSAVNNTAGAKTPLSLVFASGTIALTLIFLTGYLQYLPSVLLASIVLVSIKGLFDFKELGHLLRTNKKEFVVAMTALFAVLIFGILNGVILAAVTTLALIIKSASDPYVAFLGRIPGTKRYTDMRRHRDNENIPGILIIRIESSIFYFNTENINQRIWARIDSSIKTVILDMNASPRVDISGARFIRKLFLDLQAKGIQLKIAEALSEVRDILRAEHLEELTGHISRFVSVNDLVEETLKEGDRHS